MRAKKQHKDLRNVLLKQFHIQAFTNSTPSFGWRIAEIKKNRRTLLKIVRLFFLW